MNKRQSYKVAVSIVTKLGLWLHEKKPYELNRAEKKLYKAHRHTINYVAQLSIEELKEEGKL